MAKNKVVVVKGVGLEGGLLRATKKSTLTHRVVDTVYSADIIIPDGYRLCFTLASNLCAKGLIASNAPGGFTSGKLVVTLANVGREVVVIEAGDVVASWWFVPAVNTEIQELT